MAITKNPHFQPNGFTHLTNSLKRYQQRARERQDKGAPQTGRAASRQAWRAGIIARSHTLNNKPQRTKKHSTSRQTEQATAWLPKPIMAEVRRKMATYGWSKSYTIRTLVEIGLAHSVGEEQAATLKAMLEDIVRKHNKPYHPLYLALLLRIAKDTGQNRYLTTNVLGRMQGVTDEIVKTNLTLSEKQAIANIRHTSPQIKKLMDELDTLLQEELEGQKDA